MGGAPARRVRERVRPAIAAARPARARFWRTRPTGPDESGFTIIELVVAISILAVIAVGFAASVNLGFRTIALARQRQTATEIASARLESLRNCEYARVALIAGDTEPGASSPTWKPTQNADPDLPDHFVSADSTQYDVTGNGDYEELIVDNDASDGQKGCVLHLEDPVQVGSTVMEIYQYTTWVDDPGVAGTQDYRRLTVVVRYKAPSVNGVNRLLRMSSFFTPGTVTITPTTGLPTTTVATTTTTAASTTTTVAASCPGDPAPPTGTFSISATTGAEPGYTAAQNVTLTQDYDDLCPTLLANFSNDGVTWSGDLAYDPLNSSISWSLDPTDGTKTVYGQVRDGAGNLLPLVPQTVILDTTKPTAPSSISRSVSCSGSDRTVTLSWGASTDTNFRGYRVYRSTDGVSFSAIATTSFLSYTETHKKALDSVRYYVVGYDKAGNESDATAYVILSKNQCS